MWGDPERALRLDESDDLSMLLFQVASPAHIPWNDPRWQELLHGSDVWVHVEVNNDTTNEDGASVLQQACQSMSKHAANSSNLAALSRLVCGMLEELVPQNNNSNNNNNQQQQQQYNQVAQFSERIAVVGKARAAAGALQLIRLFIHRTIVDYGHQPSVLADIFTYRTRDSSEKDVNMASQLTRTVFQFLTSADLRPKLKQVPEVYDTAILALQLLLVMLSTQLYQPMLSSFQMQELQLQLKQQPSSPSQQSSPQEVQTDFFLDLIMEEARQQMSRNGNHKEHDNKLSPKSILSTCLAWQIERPPAPERSIAHYHYTLAKSVVAAKGEKLGPDGMYESNLVVSASAPMAKHSDNHNSNNLHNSNNKLGESSSSFTFSGGSHHHSFLLDATRGVLVQASTIIMLPFRLVSLALGLWGQHHQSKNQRSRNQSKFSGNSRTRDVLWISESPLADLASSLFLILTNNRRAPDVAQQTESNSNTIAAESENEGNPFRVELAKLSDNRWESGENNHSGTALPDLPDPLAGEAHLNESLTLLDSFDTDTTKPESLPGTPMAGHRNGNKDSPSSSLTMNFETLFSSFGGILHTEVGALLIYTLIQSSQAFSETIAVRSDLDTLVMPLLRTLYFSSSSRHVSALDFQSKSSSTPPKQHHNNNNDNGATTGQNDNAKKPHQLQQDSIRTMPFRSASQLYVIVILLLLFSQDPSFGPDVFRRTMVSSVPWYKERYLKEISLGSVLILTLLRSLTFNLNRLNDLFLLSNCCAVLMNLSHSVVDLHEYAAMRLASVTASCLKKYVALAAEQNKKNGGGEQEVDDDVSQLDLYSEVSHTLLRLLKNALSPKNVERNLNLAYALVYHQADFKRVFSMKNAPFKKSEITRIHNVIKTSAKIIESQFNARAASKALQVLNENMDQLQEAVAEKRKKGASEKEDFAFTYEEESDPEIFFVPYIWEVVVCVTTASSVEWERNSIQVFPLLEAEEVPSDVVDNIRGADGEGTSAPMGNVFANDVMDVV